MGTKRNKNKEFNEIRFKVESRTREEFFKDEEAMRNAIIYLFDKNRGFTHEVNKIYGMRQNINWDRYKELDKKRNKICNEYSECIYQLNNYLLYDNDYVKIFDEFDNKYGYGSPCDSINMKKIYYDKRVSQYEQSYKPAKSLKLYIECPFDYSLEIEKIEKDFYYGGVDYDDLEENGYRDDDYDYSRDDDYGYENGYDKQEYGYDEQGILNGIHYNYDPSYYKYWEPKASVLFDGFAEDILNGTCESLNQLKEGLKLHKKGDPFLATPQQREEIDRKIKDIEERMCELSNECRRLEDLNQNDRKPILFGKKKYNKRVEERKTQIEELKNQWTDLDAEKSNELHIHGINGFDNPLASYTKIFYTEEDRKKYDEAMKDFYNWLHYGEYEDDRNGRFVEIEDRCMLWIDYEMYIPFVQAFVDLVEKHKDLFEKMAKLEKEYKEQSKDYKIAYVNQEEPATYEDVVKVLGIDSDVVKNLKNKENVIAQKLNDLTVEELEYISESGENVITEWSTDYTREREVYLDIYNNICKDIKNLVNEKLNQNENVQQNNQNSNNNNQNRLNQNNKISKRKQISNSKKNQKIAPQKQDEYAGD